MPSRYFRKTAIREEERKLEAEREMELDEHGFLEELMALRREANWDAIPTEITDLNAWAFDYCFDQNISNVNPNSSSEPLSTQNLDEFYHPLANEFSVPEMADSAYAAMEVAAPLPFQAERPNVEGEEEEEELGFLANEIQNMEAVHVQSACKAEPNQSPELPVFNIGTCALERKNGPKKLQGQPSKNLMAERRRRKRLNDRLSMLRSIVPKISKMDRTAILADAIDYMKELLEKIGNLQREMDRTNQTTRNSFHDTKPSEFVFEVESRNGNTRIEIYCAAKPGLLLSTVNTIEALGLEIQHCVISCFNDFALQATCSQELKPEELKEALFRNAGYGGSCL
ncbi:transcription factor bHLH61-like isoform X2 [Cucurbita moschata]|uniref:Transcription factor bHLH61-like isoform X2 n=1 Tax=Cucurbita moschata TaxID=3662 RepID=A0A6J1GG97_CUCMO|nr:transcription factor bHLH61-like isoform X2 [Cucurbita moschata]